MSRQRVADIGLVIVTISWGASFLVTKSILADIPIYNFLAIRFLLAFIISSVIFIKKMFNMDKKTLKYGIILGIILFIVYALQTVGLKYTTCSKSAFITGLNVILVPLIISVVAKKVPANKTIISVILAFIGLGLLTLNQGFTGINRGDLLTFFCAVIFAFYILLVSKYTVKSKSIPLAVIQLGIVGLLNLFTSLIIEEPIIPALGINWVNILFLSVFCTSIAYIVQNVAQRYTSPTHTALIFTGEPVFAAIFAYIFFGEVLTIRGILGAVLILAGMLIVELNLKKLITRIIRGGYGIEKSQNV